MRLGIVALSLWGSTVAAAPIQWGGNGHYYEIFSPGGGITWTDAHAEAQASIFLGTPGHLVSITSEPEWNFVIANFPAELAWIGLTDEVVEGDFRWVTGEPLGFTAWSVDPTEPNNLGGNENYVHYGVRSSPLGPYGWNDIRNDITRVNNVPFRYVVEYDVAVPEFSSTAFAAIGLLAISALWISGLLKGKRIGYGAQGS